MIKLNRGYNNLKLNLTNLINEVNKHDKHNIIKSANPILYNNDKLYFRIRIYYNKTC